MRSEFARLWAHGCQTCVHRSFLRRTAAGPSERWGCAERFGDL